MSNQPAPEVPTLGSLYALGWRPAPKFAELLALEVGMRFPVEWGYPNSWMVYFMEHPIETDDFPILYG